MEISFPTNNCGISPNSSVKSYFLLYHTGATFRFFGHGRLDWTFDDVEGHHDFFKLGHHVKGCRGSGFGSGISSSKLEVGIFFFGVTHSKVEPLALCNMLGLISYKLGPIHNIIT